MYFNVSYDLISLVMLLIVSYQFFKLKRFPVVSNRLYGYLLVLGNLNILFDLTGSIAVREGSNAPVWLAYILNISYYICQILLPAALVVYLLALIENKRHINRKLYVLSCIPAALFLMIFLGGMPFGLIFKIGEDLSYSYGPLSFITYACAALYLTTMFVLVIVRRRDFTRLEKVSIYILGGLSVSAAALQFSFPDQLIVGSAVAMGFLVMFFAIQNPQMMLDSDTGLFNMRAFIFTMNANYASHKSFHIASFKLHGLHNVYMLYGREAGDKLLARVGEYLGYYDSAESFRTGDAVFTAVFKKETDFTRFVNGFDGDRLKAVPLGDAEIVPELTMICIEHAERLNGSKEMLTVIENAFEKRNITSIRNKTTYLNSTDLDFYRRNIIIENEIRRDLQSGENFQMYYQPIFSVKEGRFTSAEALVRYKSERLGRLRPDEFIPLMEDKGLVTFLDDAVVRRVFSEIEQGTFRGMGLGNIHINLSGATLTSERFINRIITLAENYEIDRSFIVFEITETAATLSGDALVKCAMMIRSAGFGLALDDFGVGYANIKRLLDLPFSHIKLDRSLTREDSGFVKEVAKLFKYFNMEIVVEGVENEDQLKSLTDAGVDMIQGFYYAKPMPGEDLAELLVGKNEPKEA